jgi:hypothetical protein
MIFKSTIRVRGYDFKYNYCNNEDRFYECQGKVLIALSDVCHNTSLTSQTEVPEPGLWIAAQILADDLASEGYETEVNYAKKGWVEVNIL